MNFIKMHAAGNDYVYIDGRMTPVEDPASLARRVSDRHKGIGSDGLVLILPSSRAHVRMRMFNADGSEAEMCGNAIRCVGKYAYEHGLVRDEELKVETLAGIKILQLQLEDDMVSEVSVDMGKPHWKPDHIPVLCPDAGQREDCLDLQLEAAGHIYSATCLSMGNPHAVIVVKKVDAVPVHELGPILEHHPFFPQRINVEFVEVQDSNNLRMRVWERGAGETQACGTGACAALCATARLGLTDREARVHVPGGELNIQWRANDHVFMRGEAVTVFKGYLL